MTDPSKSHDSNLSDRELRVAAALRENLRKRKRQQELRKEFARNRKAN